jgi:hypothetical protein
VITLTALLAKGASGGGARTAPDDPNPDLTLPDAPLAPVTTDTGSTAEPDDELGPPVRHSGMGMDEGLTPAGEEMRADPDVEKYSPSQPRVAAGSATSGQFAAGSSSSSSGGKKPKKKPAKKAPAKKKQPASGAGLRAEAKNDLAQAKQLDARATALSHQIASLHQRMAALNRVHNSHIAGNSASGSGGSAGAASSGGAAASSPSGSSAAGGSVSRTSTQITQLQHQASALSSQRKGLLNRAKQLRAQAAELSHEAAAKKSATASPAFASPAPLASPASPDLSRDLVVGGRVVLTQLTPEGLQKRFNPSQLRDRHGRWTHGGGAIDVNALAGHVASRDQEAADAIDRGQAAAAEGRHSAAEAHYSNARFSLAHLRTPRHPHEAAPLSDDRSRAEEAFSTQLSGSYGQSSAAAFQAAAWATALAPGMKGRAVNPAEKLMSNWAQQSRGEPPLPGHAADSPGSAQAPSLRGMLAQGHYGGNSQPASIMPQPMASLATVHGAGPLASSICDHQGQAQVARIDAAGAASPFLAQQLGPRYPSGNPAATPGQPVPSVRPTASQPLTPPSPYPFAGKSGVITSSAPGAGLNRFTSHVPGNPR